MPIFSSPWVELREIFGWFLAGCVVNNLCQKFPLQWILQYTILVARDKNHVIENSLHAWNRTRLVTYSWAGAVWLRPSYLLSDPSMWTIDSLALSANLFHFMPILSLLSSDFQVFKEQLVYFVYMNLELQLHIKEGCQVILQTKPCTSANLSRLFMVKVRHEKFVRMTDYQASSKLKIFSVPYNHAPQSKVVTVNNKRKIFPFLTHPSWWRRSWVLTSILIQADAYIALV